MRFKGRKWANPFFIVSLAIAGIFGVTAGVIDKKINSTNVVEKVEAGDNSSLHSNKIYAELDSSYGLDGSKGIILQMRKAGTPAWEYSVNLTGYSYDGSGGTANFTWYFMYDYEYAGGYARFAVNWGDHYDYAHNEVQIPDASSGYRWIYIYKDNFWQTMNERSFYRTITVDYDSNTTVTATGDFMGIQGEKNKSDIVFTVTNPNNDGKVCTLGQWNTSACSGAPHTNHVLTNNQKTFNEKSYTFNANQFFKPYLYNTLQYSLNGGSTWVDLDCDDPTASTRVYSASSVSMTADSQIKFRFNGSEVNPTLSYGSNFYTSGGKRYVKETGTGDISITYSSSAYSGTFGALATKTSGYYVLNYTTGDLYSTTSKGDNKYGTAITYLYNSEVIRFMYSNGSNNSYYSIKEVNPYSTAGVYSLSGGDATIIGSDYYYLEIQPTDSGEDKLYIESYGVTITYNLNGHGESFTDRVERNQTFPKPSDPSLTGYTFGGWYKEAGCTNEWDFASDTTSTDKTLYAKWTANSYTVSYNNGGHGTAPSSDSATYDDDYTTASAITGVDNYTFDHWSGDDSNDYDADETFTYNIAGDLELTAVWSANIYTITLNNVDATTAGTTTIYEKYGVGYYSDSSAITSITIPTKTNSASNNAVFGGYYTEQGGSGTQIIDASGNIIASSTAFTAGATLYAKWTVTFTFNPNASQGGSGTPFTRDVVLNGGYFKVPTKEGFTKLGYKLNKDNAWNANTDGSSTEIYLRNPGVEGYDGADMKVFYEKGANIFYANWASKEGDAAELAVVFNDEIGGICDDAGLNTNFADLKAAWDDWTRDLNENDAYWMNETRSSDTNILAMLAKYDYVLGKYGYGEGEDQLHDFLNRKPATSSAIRNFTPFDLLNNGDDNNITTVIVIVTSAVALLSITALSVLMVKKRKRKDIN